MINSNIVLDLIIDPALNSNIEELSALIKNAIDKNEISLLIEKVSCLYQDNIDIDCQTNELALKDLIPKIKNFKILKFNDNLIHNKDFKEICKTIINLPYIGQVSGFYLLAQYDNYKNINFSQNENYLTDKELREKYLTGKSNYKDKFLKYFHIDISNYPDTEQKYIFSLIEYLQYSLFSEDEHDSKIKFNLFLFIKNASLEFSLKIHKADFSTSRTALTFFKTILLLQAKEYDQIAINNRIYLSKTSYKQAHIYSFLDKITFNENLHYDNDIAMEINLQHIKNDLKNLSIEIIPNPSHKKFLYSDMLFRTLQIISNLGRIDYLYFRNINLSAIRNKYPNPLSKDSPLFTPLSELQKKAFLELYNPDCPNCPDCVDCVDYKKKYHINRKNLFILIKNKQDLIKIFLGNSKLPKKDFNNLIRNGIKLVDIHRIYLSYYRSLPSSEIFEFGLFLATIQLLYLISTTKFRIFQYSGSQGSKGKTFSTLLRFLKDNNLPQVYSIFSTALQIRYTLNLGWNKCVPLILDITTILENKFKEININANDSYSLLDSICIFYTKVTDILNEYSEPQDI